MTTGLLLLFAPAILTAQNWNSPRARTLVERATTLRAAQLADTGLRNYKAEARGYLTFLAQLGEGFKEPPKIVRTDQIVSDIYWMAPHFSKQLIKGRRDTLLLPTDISYHRDHLGIVQNNFPNIIRLGEGDEVEDVPHPLSLTGLQEYDYAIRDSLQIHLGPKVLDVYEVRVRPKDEHAGRAIGSVYIDRESAEVVRMTLSFTRAALKDKDLEDVSVVLENGLIEGRFWLPRRQEIEIRRTGTWLDYPARGIIRGRWEISDYDVNANFDPSTLFLGPEITAMPGAKVTRRGEVSSPAFTFTGGILDSLPPDVRVASDEDVRKVQDEARTLVRGQALAKGRTLALSARRLSDFAHVNRVEGTTLGAGLKQQLGGGVSVLGATSYGISDHQWKGRGGFSFTRASGAEVTILGYRSLRDVSDVPERSGVINTFASQEFGSDYTDPYFVRGASVSVGTSTLWPVRASLELAYERHDSVTVHATPVTGRYEPTLPIAPFQESRATLGFDVPTRTVAGFELSSALRLSAIRGRTVGTSEWRTWGRATFSTELTRAMGARTLVLRTLAAGVVGHDSVPLQHLVYLGGPISAAGYNFHSLVGKAGVSQRVEYQFDVPFWSIPLGAWGSAPASLTLAPYANTAWVNGLGWRPSVGVGALTIFKLFRFDVARGFHDGRWTFGFDVSRDFWNVL